jgi:antirestriction protein ArdC
MNVYEIITERIIGSLNEGVVPWRKTWVGGAAKNLVSGKDYRGVNAFLLGVLPFSSPWFATFNQIRAKGGRVRKGERGAPIVFWKVYENEESDEQRRFVLRYFTVFNVAEQCEGIVVPELGRATAVDPIEECERIVLGYENGPSIDHWEPRAWYSPATDTINVPTLNLFETAEAYYATLFHEMTHSTGHRKRLARSGVVDPHRFGSHEYSREELVAEMGASFLCAEAGISQTTLPNSVAYIGHWLKRLREDSKLVVMAAAEASKAADRILGRRAGTSTSEVAEDAAA